MKRVEFSKRQTGRGERGAALVTVVILMGLMLAVACTIVYVTVLSNTNTVDLVAEKQAYDAAEAGMQQTLNVLRGNTTVGLAFHDAATRTLSNKTDDWYPFPRLSKWLNYTYPASQPDRVPLTSPYDPYSGMAYSVDIYAPDEISLVGAGATPLPGFVDGPIVANNPLPAQPSWHPWHCGHCSHDYTHCSLYNGPNSPLNGVAYRQDGLGCRHKHCNPVLALLNGADDRLIVRVTGYGPHGARQQIEMMVDQRMFDYEDDQVFLFRSSQYGGDLVFTTQGNPQVTFDSGDHLTAFGLTNANDQTILQNVINQPNKVSIVGKGDDYEVIPQSDWPDWLVTADAARKMVSDLETDAKLRSRWFTSYPTNNDGTDTAPELTFIRGNASLTSDGAGILVVTGTLTINSDRHFKGLILLLGDGTLNVTSGKTTLEGCVVVAKFGATGDFQAPAMNMQGNPTVTFKHNETMMDLVMSKDINLGVKAVRSR